MRTLRNTPCSQRTGMPLPRQRCCPACRPAEAQAAPRALELAQLVLEPVDVFAQECLHFGRMRARGEETSGPLKPTVRVRRRARGWCVDNTLICGRRAFADPASCRVCPRGHRPECRGARVNVRDRVVVAPGTPPRAFQHRFQRQAHEREAGSSSARGDSRSASSFVGHHSRNFTLRTVRSSPSTNPASAPTSPNCETCLPLLSAHAPPDSRSCRLRGRGTAVDRVLDSHSSPTRSLREA